MQHIYNSKNNKLSFFSLLSTIFMFIATLLLPVSSSVYAATSSSVISHYQSLEPPTVGNYTCPEKEGAIMTFPMQGSLKYGLQKNDTLKGIGDFTSCVYVMPDNSMEFINQEVFTGWIEKCGTGTLKMEITGTISPPDPDTGNQSNQGNWNFIPNSGRNGFKKITTGSGIEKSTVSPTFDTVGVFSGDFTCSAK